MNDETFCPGDDECAKGTRDWPHAPPHRLTSAGVYFVTALAADQRHLLIEAWAILSNHYHFIGHSPSTADGAAVSLSPMLRKLHSLATKELNRREGAPGRSRLWQNFRETHLTHQKSYLARLHYVHQNAVHHKLVAKGSDWKWCSAARFAKAVSPAWLKTITSFKYDEIALKDGE